MDDRLPEAVLDYQLDTQLVENSRYVKHFVQDPDQPPSAPPRIEKWKKKKSIGSGGQGQVFLQECTAGHQRGKFRAIKVIPSSSESQRRLHARELETMARFSHQKYSKHFVRMLGWYYTDAGLSISMEYLSGGDLYTYVCDNLPLAEHEAQQIMSQVVQGLAMMHKGGFAHRDIKPQNVLIQRCPTEESPFWWVKLADFGISKRLDAAMTVGAGPIGTLEFLSPEIVEQTEANPSYQKSDIWAVGVMAFFVLTKLRGFQRHRHKLESTTAPFPDRNISLDGLDFILRLTSDQPSGRPESTEVLSHPWVDQYIPKFGADDNDDDNSSLSSSSDSELLSIEQEMTTLTTKLTDTELGVSPDIGSQGATTRRADPTKDPITSMQTALVIGFDDDSKKGSDDTITQPKDNLEDAGTKRNEPKLWRSGWRKPTNPGEDSLVTLGEKQKEALERLNESGNDLTAPSKETEDGKPQLDTGSIVSNKGKDKEPTDSQPYGEFDYDWESIRTETDTVAGRDENNGRPDTKKQDDVQNGTSYRKRSEASKYESVAPDRQRHRAPEPYPIETKAALEMPYPSYPTGAIGHFDNDLPQQHATYRQSLGDNPGIQFYVPGQAATANQYGNRATLVDRSDARTYESGALRTHLDAYYSVQHSYKFHPGAIFKTYRVIPRGSPSQSAVNHNKAEKPLGDFEFLEYRKFIVVVTEFDRSTCVPISSYEGRACTKKGVKPINHGIVYDQRNEYGLVDKEPALGFDPVCAVMTMENETISKEARVNYAKPSTLEHNIEVCFIGKVHENDWDIVLSAYDTCWQRAFLSHQAKQNGWRSIKPLDSSSSVT